MALGRGLGEILLEVEEAYEKDLSDIGSFEMEAQGARVEDLDVDSISPNPFQPRKYFDEQALKELSQSILDHGLLQPIVVIEKEDGYLLIAGERRLRASRMGKLTHIKAIIADVEIDEIRLRELSLIENIQRENLNAIELAHSYSELLVVHNITDISLVVHKSRSQISNTIRLLNLSEYVQNYLIDGSVSQGHAKVLIGLNEPTQKIIIDSVIAQKLNVRETETLVKRYKNNLIQKPIKIEKKYILKSYEKELKSSLPFKYKIKDKNLIISLDNEKDIKNFLTLIKKS